MATYSQIQAYIKEKYGFLPKTCWIADVKESCSLPVRKAYNGEGKRKHHCPPNRREFIVEALRHFKIINELSTEK